MAYCRVTPKERRCPHVVSEDRVVGAEALCHRRVRDGALDHRVARDEGKSDRDEGEGDVAGEGVLDGSRDASIRRSWGRGLDWGGPFQG